MPDQMDDPFGSMPATEAQEERVANPVAVANAEDKVLTRSTVESEFNGKRHARELEYISQKNELESSYRGDLEQIRKDKEAALNAVGLNHDGSDPQGRQQGLSALLD